MLPNEETSNECGRMVLSRSLVRNERRQGVYWLLTIPRDKWTPELPSGCAYVRGQAEQGEQSAYEHWQVLAITEKKTSLAGIKRMFGNQVYFNLIQIHGELTYSKKAEDYVWKELTRIADTQFEFGERPFKRNNGKDWEEIWQKATSNDLAGIDVQVRICHYNTLRRIAADHLEPIAMERTCYVFWGKTGTGKSRRAWEESTLCGSVYSKDPRTKFWCGYQNQKFVVIDEFRGGIDISHMLRWTDRYAVRVELKGASTALMAEKYWITSNLHPKDWYPELDYETYQALERRLIIEEIQ